MEQYNEIVNDCQAYRKWLDEMIVNHPEWFPENISDGYLLHDDRSSAKLEKVRLRRICLKARDSEGKEQVFTIAPSGVMPYFVGMTDEIEKALFLRRFDAPFFGIWPMFLGTMTSFGTGWSVTTWFKPPSKTQRSFPSTCWPTKK